MIAEAEQGEAQAVEDEQVEERAYAFTLLDVTESLGTHFHEHHDSIVAWSWKLFCAKWARMLEQASKREAERLAKEERRREEETMRELAQANSQAAAW